MLLNLGVIETGIFFPLELGNFEVILGIQRLEKLGNISTNWKLHIMQF